MDTREAFVAVFITLAVAAVFGGFIGCQITQNTECEKTRRELIKYPETRNLAPIKCPTT